MDLEKIFLKEACPTSVGGQAIIEGIMMKGEEKLAIAVRMPDGAIHLKTQKLEKTPPIAKIPIIRGIYAFGVSLVTGTKILMQGAEMLEKYEEKNEENLNNEKEKSQTLDDKFTAWLEEKFGKHNAWNIMMYFSVCIALLFTVGVFIVAPTALVNWCGNFVKNHVMLNLIEGIFRICMFVLYIWAIAHMKEIKRVFQFHGAEHKTIHCFENKLELTPDNSQEFYTLHPRCGTSFLMFVMLISLVIFSFLGWPNLLMRISSRIIFIPLIAGLSYEVLKWAGKSDNIIVKILSMPGLYLQKITTREPEKEHLEIAIVAMKAVLDLENKEELDVCLSSYEEFEEKIFKSEEEKSKERIDEIFEKIEE